MRVLTARDFGDLVCEQAPDPDVGPGQVLVETKVSAVSAGTERRMLYGRPDDVREHAPKFPVVGAFGYLAAGVVAELGEGVDGLSVGDRVSCGRQWGAHRELLDTDASSVLPIPDDMSFLEAAAAYWAVPPLAGILAGKHRFYADTAVIGLGPLGLCAVQMLVPSSRRVLGLDLAPNRLQIAEGYGAVGIDGASADPAAAVADVSPEGPEVVIEASGSQAGLELALEIVKPLGRVVLVGVPPLLNGMDLFWPLQVKGVQIVPLHRESAASPQDGGASSPRAVHLPDVIDMISRGLIDIEGLTSWVVPVEAGPEAMALLHNHPDRVLGTAFAWDVSEERSVAEFNRAL